jgi:hypothetical protein
MTQTLRDGTLALSTATTFLNITTENIKLRLTTCSPSLALQPAEVLIISPCKVLLDLPGPFHQLWVASRFRNNSLILRASSPIRSSSVSFSPQ